VAEHEGKHFCFVVSTSGIERRHVTIGENNEKFVEIQDGLVEEERVMLDARTRIEQAGKKKNDSAAGSQQSNQ
jgi:hypothetical protein